jgi:hypothetical protein
MERAHEVSCSQYPVAAKTKVCPNTPIPWSFADREDSDRRIDGSLEVVKELSGIPLAIEQSGALIRYGEYSFIEFLVEYKDRYRDTMTFRPPEDVKPAYDKNRIMTTILDMALRSLEDSSESATLLLFLGVLGPWRVPIEFLQSLELAEISVDEDVELADKLKQLKDLLGDHHRLRLRLRRLASLWLLRLSETNGALKTSLIHRILCQWSVDKLSPLGKAAFMMQAAHGLASAVCDLDLERARYVHGMSKWRVGRFANVTL